MTIGSSTLTDCYISGILHNTTVDAKTDKKYVDDKIAADLALKANTADIVNKVTFDNAMVLKANSIDLFEAFNTLDLGKVGLTEFNSAINLKANISDFTEIKAITDNFSYTSPMLTSSAKITCPYLYVDAINYKSVETTKDRVSLAAE